MNFSKEYDYSMKTKLRFELLQHGVPVFVEYSEAYLDDKERLRQHADTLSIIHNCDCVVTVVPVFEWSERR